MLFSLIFGAGCVESSLVPEQSDTTTPADCVAADEICDGLDNDCDGSIDDGSSDATTWYQDLDGDGFGGNAVGMSCEAPAGAVADGGDCADEASERFPGAGESCDTLGVDDDCDGLVDTDDTDIDPSTLVSSYTDADGDGWGAGTAMVDCTAQNGAATVDGDCDDADSAIHPTADDICFDDIDGNCDGSETGCLYPDEVALDATFPTLWAEDGDDFAGAAVSILDMNGDGEDDVLVGAANAGADYSGKAYLEYGPFSGAMHLSDADVTFHGTQWGQWGTGVHAADLTGDGQGDLIVSSNGGFLAAFTGPIDATDLVYGDADWSLEVDESIGRGMSTADLNGDGTLDLLVGDTFANDWVGAAYYFYGPITTDITPADADVTWTGTTYLSALGFAMNLVGDVDGDGTNDVGIAAPSYWDPGDTEAFYVESGDDLQGGSIDDSMASLLGPTNVVESCGLSPLGEDMNDDGYSDVILGCPDGEGAVGYVAIAWGPLSGVSQILDLADRVVGEGPFGLGVSLQAGDLDGDAEKDLMLGWMADKVVTVPGPISGTQQISDVVGVTYEGADVGSSVGFAIESLDNDGVSSWAFGSGAVNFAGSEVPAVYIVPKQN